MGQTIFYALVLFVTILGFVGILYYVMLKLMTPKGEGRAEITVFISPGEEDVDLLLRGANFRASLFGDSFYRKVVVIDFSGDRDTQTICQSICAELHMDYRKEEACPALYAPEEHKEA